VSGARARCRRAGPSDVDSVTALLALLYDDATPEELRAENEAALADGGQAVFLARAGGADVGVAHVTVRNECVEGTHGGGVCYLEGVYVAPGYRRMGVGRALLARCEAWAREAGCPMFASDCELGNEGGAAFHMGAGFSEVRRIICFAKPL